MPQSRAYRRAYEPLQIKNVRFKNRLWKTPACMGWANKSDGHLNQDYYDFYESIARGGVGGIITDHFAVDYVQGIRDGMPSAAADERIPGLAELAEVVHKYDCPIIMQINHNGPRAHFPPQPEHAGFQAVSASALDDEELSNILFHGIKGWKLHSLTIPEIKQLVVKYADAAERAKIAGFDGVELHGDHYYLINTFLSRMWNRRDDEYGCQSLENRARFALEIFQACRNRVAEDFLIGIKLNGAEYGRPEGTTSEECQAFARMFEAAGVDYFNIVGEGYGRYGRLAMTEQIFYPEPPKPIIPQLKNEDFHKGMNVHLAAAVKKVVSVPVVAVGRLDAALCDKIRADGRADAVAIGRRLIADPEYPNKAREGREDDVRPCTSCVTCESRSVLCEGVRCQVNASVGRGGNGDSFSPAEKSKKVIVVGGGPSGMEAARVLALRGHDVTLYEKETYLGGLLNLAAMVKGTEIFGLPEFVSYLKGQIAKLGVKVKLGEEFTAALADKANPDVIILAVGGLPDTLDIPGIDGPNVLTSKELQQRAKMALRLAGPELLGRITKMWLPVGKKVVIIGGGIQGLECAEFLVKRGRQVVVTEKSAEVGVGIPILQLQLLMPWLAEKRVPILTGVGYREVTDKGLRITDDEGHEQMLAADTIMVTVPFRPNTQLFEDLSDKVPKVHMVGDCKEPRLIIDAVADGFNIGRAV